MYFHEIRPQTLPQTLSRFCLNQPILQRQKSAICPKNGAVHPRKTRVPPQPRRYFLLSALRSFARWFSCQGTYVSRRRWRLPGAGALVDVRGLQLDQSGAPSAIYRSRAQPGGRLESLVVRDDFFSFFVRDPCHISPFFVKCYHGFEKRLRLVKAYFYEKYLFHIFIFYSIYF